VSPPADSVPAVPPETKAAPGVPGVPDDATVQMLQIPARPVAFLRGKSDWENGFKSIMKSMNTIEAEVTKAGLKQGGKPITVFVETTAYLDEKGLEAQNLFIEEYLTDTKNADDQGLQVDIYVFIK
jgi:effector-binding domain-containing protein